MISARPTYEQLEAEVDHLRQRSAELETLLNQAQQEAQAMKRNQSGLRRLVEATSDWLWITDTNAVYTYVSPRVTDFLGYEPHEVVGKTPFHLMPADEAERIAAIFGPIATELQPVIALANTNQHKDGRLVVLETSGVPFFNEAGEYQGYLGIDRDITQRLENEERMRSQADLLRELSTPLIPVSENVVIMPLIGAIDSARAQLVMETLLEGVGAHRAAIAILDITGVSVVDTQVANALIRAAQAVRLLGAQVMLTGISPQVAQTLVQLGADLSSITTYSSLQTGIVKALTNQH
jgi:anti-anti-sigma factor